MADKYGIRVVQQGQDIKYTPPDEISYSSEFQSPKVSVPYRGFIQGDNLGNGSVTINHGLSYAPMALAFWKNSSGGWQATDNDTIGIETNRRNFVIRLRKNIHEAEAIPEFKNRRVPFKVWIMLDPAQEII